VHQRLLDGYDRWETVQHPVNLIDPHYLSFINSVLPNIRRKGLGLLAMKTNAIGNITKNRIATIPEFAWELFLGIYCTIWGFRRDAPILSKTVR